MSNLVFEPCERGFLFSEQQVSGAFPKIWAFATVEEAAIWLRERYSPAARPAVEVSAVEGCLAGVDWQTAVIDDRQRRINV